MNARDVPTPNSGLTRKTNTRGKRHRWHLRNAVHFKKSFKIYIWSMLNINSFRTFPNECSRIDLGAREQIYDGLLREVWLYNNLFPVELPGKIYIPQTGIEKQISQSGILEPLATAPSCKLLVYYLAVPKTKFLHVFFFHYTKSTIQTSPSNGDTATPYFAPKVLLTGSLELARHYIDLFVNIHD